MTRSPIPSDALVHLCSAGDWARAQASGELRPESLDTVGFVHMSTPQQVHQRVGRDRRSCHGTDPAAPAAGVRHDTAERGNNAERASV
ncbi:hypothetical protein A5671_14995 [Mycolicibacter heraklionensis]|nr:hypothetical protein A5671_14995 [Mycolicibacter heraklionensis]